MDIPGNRSNTFRSNYLFIYIVILLSEANNYAKNEVNKILLKLRLHRDRILIETITKVSIHN